MKNSLSNGRAGDFYSGFESVEIRTGNKNFIHKEYSEGRKKKRWRDGGEKVNGKVENAEGTRDGDTQRACSWLEKETEGGKTFWPERQMQKRKKKTKNFGKAIKIEFSQTKLIM